jgi:hypothetical protein
VAVAAAPCWRPRAGFLDETLNLGNEDCQLVGQHLQDLTLYVLMPLVEIFPYSTDEVYLQACPIPTAVNAKNSFGNLQIGILNVAQV